ncbi:MAG: ATP-binding protein [Deltaproteobacteria bacterium]|nr:ATP-binding protein [Deltaproteobacteria bacterium]
MLPPQNAEAPLPRVRRVVVRGLFGLYDHDIPLTDKPRVTIIHGPNGVGKTSVLRLVDAALWGDAARVNGVKATAVEVSFDDGGARLAWPGNEGVWAQAGVLTSRADEARDRPLGPSRLIGVRRIEPVRGANRAGRSVSRPSVDWVSQRILTDYAGHLSAYGALAQRLDQSLLERLLALPPSGATPAKLAALLEAVHATQDRLIALGLIEGVGAPRVEATALAQLEPGRADALALSLSDAQAKLAVWAPFADRLEVLLRQVGGKLVHKTLRFYRDQGLVVTGADGFAIPLSALSSGEQHELVMTHALLFDVAPNALVLIDEPELSLHVLWQRRFIDDLIEISDLVGFDALVATHSPFIIGAHDDLLVDLDARLDPPGDAAGAAR